MLSNHLIIQLSIISMKFFTDVHNENFSYFRNKNKLKNYHVSLKCLTSRIVLLKK